MYCIWGKQRLHSLFKLNISIVRLLTLHSNINPRYLVQESNSANQTRKACAAYFQKESWAWVAGVAAGVDSRSVSVFEHQIRASNGLCASLHHPRCVFLTDFIITDDLFSLLL
jgi:hypothetical protein